jgi:hypothetical protein
VFTLHNCVTMHSTKNIRKGNVRSQNTRIRCEFACISERDGIKLHDTNWCEIVPHQKCRYIQIKDLFLWIVLYGFYKLIWFFLHFTFYILHFVGRASCNDSC